MCLQNWISGRLGWLLEVNGRKYCKNSIIYDKYAFTVYVHTFEAFGQRCLGMNTTFRSSKDMRVLLAILAKKRYWVGQNG